MRHKYSVIIIRKSNFKCKPVVKCTFGFATLVLLLLLHLLNRYADTVTCVSCLTSCLVVCYIVPVSVPADLLLLRLLVAVNQWFHAHVICRIWLHEVNNVESVCYVAPCVLDPKVIPLGVARCTVVVLKVQIVLRLRYFYCFL
jgi:hypothetical protein